jgi:hypothetical protein
MPLVAFRHAATVYRNMHARDNSQSLNGTRPVHAVTSFNVFVHPCVAITLSSVGLNDAFSGAVPVLGDPHPHARGPSLPGAPLMSIKHDSQSHAEYCTITN